MKKIAALFVIIAAVSGCSTVPKQESSTSTTSSAATAKPAAPVAAAAPAAPASDTSSNHSKLTVVKVDSEETAGENGAGANAVDGNPDTIWHTEWQDASPEHPHEIIIKLNEPTTLKGFTYLPRQDDSENGMIKDYEFYVSDDGKDFGQPVKKGTFDSGKEKKTATFDAKKCQFIKLRALSEINDAAWTSAAEIGVIAAD
jgi:F5/8 type C domain-containing protein